MRRQQREKKKPAVPKDEELPPQIGTLIRGRTVTISDDGRFFPKRWEAMLPVVGSEAKQVGRSFELSKSLFHKFMVYLRVDLREKNQPQYEKFEPSDWIAQALCKASEELVPDESEYLDDRLWPEDRPISQAWQNIGSIPSALWGFDDLFEYAGPKEQLQPVTDSQFRYPRVRLRVYVPPDPERQGVPELRISIKGEPVSVLINAAERAGAPSETMKEEARKMWESLNRSVSVRLGIQQATQGRPSTALGEDAAWLHDHAGLSWAKVAPKLCSQKHQHDSHCTDNYKQQAKQFWKREREKYEELARIKEQVTTRRIHPSSKQK